VRLSVESNVTCCGFLQNEKILESALRGVVSKRNPSLFHKTTRRYQWAAVWYKATSYSMLTRWGCRAVLRGHGKIGSGSRFQSWCGAEFWCQSRPVSVVRPCLCSCSLHVRVYVSVHAHVHVHARLRAHLHVRFNFFSFICAAVRYSRKSAKNVTRPNTANSIAVTMLTTFLLLLLWWLPPLHF
jgi:hypothetical protein